MCAPLRDMPKYIIPTIRKSRKTQRVMVLRCGVLQGREKVLLNVLRQEKKVY